MRQWKLLVGCVVLLMGCAALKQIKADYALGKETPLAEGEVSPREVATGLVDPVQPFLPKPVPAVLLTALTLWGTWRRGRGLRTKDPTSVNPITGALGQRVGLEAIVQTVSSISRGVEFGPEGSGIRRFSKILILGVLVIAALPPVQAFALAHPVEIGTLLGSLAALGGLEKELSKVLPVKPPEG